MNVEETGKLLQQAPERLSKEDVQALMKAFEEFTRTTRTMEEAYRLLQERLQALDKELADKNRELAVASDYLNSILESISDGVIAVDNSGRITAFNQAASQILGFPPEDVIGCPFRDIFRREFAVPAGRHVMELRTKDDRTVTVSERDSSLSDREGRRIGTVKVFQDLTEIRELRSRMRRKERLAAIGEMAAIVAHEIRNPLGGISGFASLLARDLKTDEPRLRLVEKILQGTRDLERLVEGLLEYTRPIQLRLRWTNCADQVDAATGFIELNSRPIQITNEVPRDLHIMADPDRLRQVFLNILLNAVESISQAGEIRIYAEVDTQHVRILFADTGCGMTPEQMERVFSPFYTTKEKGTGLGLAVAAKIVEAHSGTLSVTSKPGEGSTFCVCIPKTE